jgi:hypothetical protein
MEPESIKFVAIIGGAVVAKLLGEITAVGVPSIDKWIERGGTGMCMIFMWLALKNLRGMLDGEKADRLERQKRLDEMHEKSEQNSVKSAEARAQLATALDKLTEKLNK